MAKRFEKGDIAYLRVEISDFCKTGDRFDYLARIPHEGERSEFPFCVKDEEVKTAEEVVKENYPLWDGVTQMDRITALEAENASLKESLHEASEENSANDEALAQMNIKKAELEAENEKLKRQLDGANELLTDAEAQVKKLTEADCMRLQEFKPIIEERDRLKAEVATRTDNVKNLVEENDRLRAEMDRLKKTLEERAENVMNLLEENDRLKKLLNRQEESMRGVEEYADQLKKIADDLGDENEKLKAENDQERKRTQVWKDASEEHRQAAEELKADIERYEEDKTDLEWEVKRNESEINKLHADNLELKAQINAFQSDPKEVEELKNGLANARGQADLFKSERDEFDVQIKKYKDTLRKWGKKIHSQEAGIKQRDLIISLLAARAIELEEGGESNG